MFKPALEIGQVINNQTLCQIFQCSPQGGMRKSNTTNTLVIIANYVKGIYHDKWIGGVLHYTGMGLNGDQDIDYMQNYTLNHASSLGVDVFLFEVMEDREYTYCGRVEVVDTPYTEVQPDKDGKERNVWMFPVRPVPDNNVAKPSHYVFSDMADYAARGKMWTRNMPITDVNAGKHTYLRRKSRLPLKRPQRKMMEYCKITVG